MTRAGTTRSDCGPDEMPRWPKPPNESRMAAAPTKTSMAEGYRPFLGSPGDFGSGDCEDQWPRGRPCLEGLRGARVRPTDRWPANYESGVRRRSWIALLRTCDVTAGSDSPASDPPLTALCARSSRPIQSIRSYAATASRTASSNVTGSPPVAWRRRSIIRSLSEMTANSPGARSMVSGGSNAKSPRVSSGTSIAIVSPSAKSYSQCRPSCLNPSALSPSAWPAFRCPTRSMSVGRYEPV